MSSDATVTVVVTRPARQASELTRLLEGAGVTVIAAPVIACEPVNDSGVGRALSALAGVDVLVLTSANGAERVVDRLAATGAGAHVLETTRVVAIGPATAGIVRAHGVEPALVAPAGLQTSAGLLELLAGGEIGSMTGARVLVIRAATGSPVLVDGLRALGALVDVVPAYRTIAEELTTPQVEEIVAADLVTIASGSAVNHLVAAVERIGRTASDIPPVASIGPVASTAARRAGLTVVAEASSATSAGLAAAVHQWIDAAR